jgi:RND family efflux transporter MFP subunit
VTKTMLGSILLVPFTLVLASAVLSDAQNPPAQPAFSAASSQQSEFVVPGTTQCILKRKGILAPAVLHPVTEVLVSVGDAVKKGQPLIQIDDDEPQADVRVKKANLESAGIAMREARRYLVSLEKLQAQGAVAEQRIHDARATALKIEADERAAKAAVDLAVAELEHYVVSAPVDGIVNRLQVHPGMVSRPGTTVWGEVLDIKEIDVRCKLTADQADAVKVGDEVEVLTHNSTTSHGSGRLVFIGLEANPQDGKIPALVRLANPQSKLRCEIPVKIRFAHSNNNK